MRISDWSSDVCSSDLIGEPRHGGQRGDALVRQPARDDPQQDMLDDEIGDPGDEREQREAGSPISSSRDRKSTRLNSSNSCEDRMPSSTWTTNNHYTVYKHH